MRVTLLLIFLFMHTSCAELQFETKPTKTIRNAKCFESQKLKTFQVLEDGALAYLCPTEFKSYFDDAFDACFSEGDIVYMPVNPQSNDYVDNQRIELSEDMCFINAGTYKYESKDGRERTVRKINISQSQIPNPEYKESTKAH